LGEVNLDVDVGGQRRPVRLAPEVSGEARVNE
jgi:hypothetical protein